MAAVKSYAIPACTNCNSTAHMRRDDAGKWFCLECADEWLKNYVATKVGGKSIGGVILPRGAKDERRKDPTFRDLMPNRAMRRRLARAR